MKLHTLIAAAVFVLTSNSTFASGNHAGGHGHGSQDSAVGVPGRAEQVTRTVEVDMTDNMRFSPASIQVKQGETIRFKVKNSGHLKHEFVLGTDKELKDHYQAMLKNPEMEHEEANMITLAGSKSGEVIWQFTKAGKVHFACLQPGHYDAGMKGAVSVAKTAFKATSVSAPRPTATPEAPQTASSTAAPVAGAASATVASTELVDGEVRKIDLANKKITLRHGEIKSVSMPPMTMVFQVTDAALLDNIKVGDKVRFAAEKGTSGFVVTQIQLAQ